MDELEDLYQQKGNTRDKVELRKIRSKIRRELRKKGEYTSTRARGYAAPRRKRRELSEEEYVSKRTRSIKNKERREEKAGQRAVTTWKRMGPLHTKTCRCVACVLAIPHRNERPSRKVLLRWYQVLKRGGVKVNRVWIESTWSKICIEGKIPKEGSKAETLVEVMKLDEWY